jgi:hypothetical protein
MSFFRGLGKRQLFEKFMEDGGTVCVFVGVSVSVSVDVRVGVSVGVECVFRAYR